MGQSFLRIKIPQQVQQISTFYGTQNFSTVFIRPCHSSLSWARLIKSTPSSHIYLNSIPILSFHLCIGLPCALISSGFWIETLCAFLFSPHTCHMICPFHPIWLNLLNMKLYITQFYPVTCYFLSLSPNYLPQHRILKTPSGCVCPVIWQNTFYTNMKEEAQL